MRADPARAMDRDALNPALAIAPHEAGSATRFYPGNQGFQLPPPRHPRPSRQVRPAAPLTEKPLAEILRDSKRKNCEAGRWAMLDAQEPPRLERQSAQDVLALHGLRLHPTSTATRWPSRLVQPHALERTQRRERRVAPGVPTGARCAAEPRADQIPRSADQGRSGAPGGRAGRDGARGAVTVTLTRPAHGPCLATLTRGRKTDTRRRRGLRGAVAVPRRGFRGISTGTRRYLTVTRGCTGQALLIIDECTPRYSGTAFLPLHVIAGARELNTRARA